MILTHRTLGQGTLVSQDENNVTIDFNGVVKTFIIKYAGLINEDGSPFGVSFVPKPKKVKSQRKISEQFSITKGGSFDSTFNSISEREDWKEERQRKSMQSVSW